MMKKFVLAIMMVMTACLISAFAATVPYVVYTSGDRTMTFYYDDQRDSRPGIAMDLNRADDEPDWRELCLHDSVVCVVFDPTFADASPTSTYRWFYEMTQLRSIIGLNYLHTSEVTNMKQMFSDCRLLTSLDLRSFNTYRVKDAYEMFNGCSSLVTIKVSRGWITSNFNDDYNPYVMFRDCTSLVGGRGTVYNSSNVDKSYAHIDGGAENPGYFTDVSAPDPGDVDGDGSITISDVTALIDLLLSGDATSNNVADVNRDGTVGISDVTTLVDMLLSAN